MSADAECIFCKIIAGDIPCFKLFEDERTLAFMDINPANDGHALVIPKEHARDVYVIAPESLAAVAVTARRVARAVDQTLKPEGLCRDDVCVPVRDRNAIELDGGLDLVAVAELLGSPTMIAADEAVVAVGVPAARRQEALERRRAPDVELPDLDGVDHRLTEWDGRRRLLVAFATW